MFKRFLSLLITACLFIGLLPTFAVGAAEAQSEFSGSRSVEFTFESSNLDNYANGGRAAVDLYLRKFSPDWLTYNLRASGRNVVLSYDFSFTSFEDYYQKLGVLAGYMPDVFYKPGEDMILIEEFDATRLLEGLQQQLGESQELSRWAKVTKDSFTLCGKTYDVAGSNVNIQPEASNNLRFESVEIVTEPGKKELTRTLTVAISKEYTETEEWKDIVSGFEDAGDTEEEEFYSRVELSVTFTASTHQALVKKTSELLGVPISTSEKIVEVGENECKYIRTENLLINNYIEDDAEVHYTYILDENMKKPTAESEFVEISEDGEASTVEANGQTRIKFGYTAPFRFDSVKVLTEKTSAFTKYKRTITLSSPVKIVEGFHEKIKSELSKKLPKGAVLDIHDELQTRYYVLTLSTWSISELEALTNIVMKTDISVKESLIPFLKSSFSEKVVSLSTLDDFTTAYSVEFTYRMPGKASGENGVKTDGALVFTDGFGNIKVQYRYFNLIITALLLIAVAAVTVAILLLVKKVILPHLPKKAKKEDAATEEASAEALTEQAEEPAAEETAE